MNRRPRNTNVWRKLAWRPPAPLQHLWALRGRWRASWRWLLAALTVMVLGTGVGLYLYTVTHAGTFTGGAIVSRPSGTARPFAWPFRLTGRANILLIGVDITINERHQVLPVSRSDTLMLVSFDPQRARVNVLSIPRDTFTVIPRLGPDRINAAYAAGGPRLTIPPVEDRLAGPVHTTARPGRPPFGRFTAALVAME